MNSPMNKPMNRREFFRTSARWLALGGLAALGGILAVRAKDCELPHSCGGCLANGTCELPKARATTNRRSPS